MNKTSIEWTDLTSNPIYAVDKVTGKRGWFCTKVSEGCGNCYAEALNMRFGNGLAFTVLNSERVEFRLNERELEAIQKRKKPARIFVGDMLDLFHEGISDTFLAAVFQTMADAPQHTFQVLTKQAGRMRQFLDAKEGLGLVAVTTGYPYPLPNVHLGVSVENQKAADERYGFLRDTPAAVRFYSVEPLLGPIPKLPLEGISWVICGGESGPKGRWLVERCQHWRHRTLTFEGEPHTRACTGWRPKPEALAWVQSIRDQCQAAGGTTETFTPAPPGGVSYGSYRSAAGLPFMFKQWGGPTPKAGGRLLDDREWNEYPA